MKSQIIKCSVFLFLLITGLCTAQAGAATLIIENNTGLTLRVVREHVRFKKPELVAFVPPVSEKKIEMTKGYWNIEIIPEVSGDSTDDFDVVRKSVLIDSDDDVRTIVLLDEDFGRSAIVGSPCDPTMNGKYSKLLDQLNIPDDVGKFGKCNDWGKWSGTRYKGHNNLPTGYWVYKYPTWYIWGEKNFDSPPSDITDTGHADSPSSEQTGSGGCQYHLKYKTLLRKISVPRDYDVYNTKCVDSGRWEGSEYKGHINLPEGKNFWVYDYPYWYIYKEVR